MSQEQLILNKITEVLEVICEIEGNRKYIFNYTDDSFIWTVQINSPFKIKKVNYIIPLHNSFLPSTTNENEYFIDVFKQNDNNEIKNSLTSDEFYHFLINLDGYKAYLDEDSELKQICKLHINRHVDMFADFNNYLEQPIKKINELLKIWENQNHKPLLLLGDRGMGKTWSVKKFCFDNIMHHYSIKDKKRKLKNYWLNTPAIYISLRKLAIKLKDVKVLYQAITNTISETYKINFFDDTNFLQALLKTGNIILVLDGLDEMSTEQSSEISNRNLWELYHAIGDSNKIILTSRISYFSSYDQIKEFFAYKNFINESSNEIIVNRSESRIRRDFNIWLIKEFDSREKEDLYNNYNLSGNKTLIQGVNKFQKIESSNYPIGTIENEISEISKIPALYNIIVKNLGRNKQSYFSIYEMAINDAIFRFNITSERSIRKFITIEPKLKTERKKIDFKTDDKNTILKSIAWYTFSRGYASFSLEEFSNMISDIAGINYDIIINDLRGQTVIKVSDVNYSFLSESIYAYYVALYILEFLNDNNFSEFFNCLGYNNFLDQKLGIRVLNFLKEALNSKPEHRKEVAEKIKTNLIENRPYSPNIRYLLPNLEKIDFNINDCNELNLWFKYPLGQFNKFIYKIVNNNFVLIPSNPVPFYLSQTEVTNIDFMKFLGDAEFHGDYWKRYGPFWKDAENPYQNVINVYHLLFWKQGNLPSSKEHHPVVYLSWFGAAMFCNWLTYKLNIRNKDNSEIDYFYEFIPYIDKVSLKEVLIKNDSIGFRLPEEDEWDFAACEGNFGLNYYWDKYKNQDGVLLPEGKKLKNKLLSEGTSSFPIRFEKPNDYGIFGLWGNVREWVNKSMISKVNGQDYSIIKGSTWLLNEDGFLIGNKEEVFAQNTNFDVGFRVAKSLDTSERKLYAKSRREFKNFKNI